MGRECIQWTRTGGRCNNTIGRLKRNIDRRPAAEEIDNKSELNCNEEMENIQSKCDKVESVSIKDIKSVKDELIGLKDGSKVKADLTKVATDTKGRNKSLENNLSEKMNVEIKDIDTKVKSFENRSDSKRIDVIEVDKKTKPAKDDFNISIDGKLKKYWN